jgi:hypothetical protein
VQQLPQDLRRLARWVLTYIVHRWQTLCAQVFRPPQAAFPSCVLRAAVWLKSHRTVQPAGAVPGWQQHQQTAAPVRAVWSAGAEHSTQQGRVLGRH